MPRKQARNEGFGERVASRLPHGEQKRLATDLGVDVTTVNRWTKGMVPEAGTLVSLSRALNVSTDYLLTGQDPPARLAPDELPQPVVFFSSALESPPADLNRRSDFTAVPLVDGSIAAGSARVVSENIEDWAWIHQSQLGDRHRLVAVRVKGDSMNPVLPDGSMVVIDLEDREIVPGAPYAVRIDDDGACTVKYLEEDGDELVLIPENRTHRETRVRRNSDSPDPVVGRVVWSWRVWVRPDESSVEFHKREPKHKGENRQRHQSSKRK